MLMSIYHRWMRLSWVNVESLHRRILGIPETAVIDGRGIPSLFVSTV
jgi:hypothetical protein